MILENVICCSSLLSIPNTDYILSQMNCQASTGDLPCHFWLLKWNVMSNINLTIYDLSNSAFWSDLLEVLFMLLKKQPRCKAFKGLGTKRKEACLLEEYSSKFTWTFTQYTERAWELDRIKCNNKTSLSSAKKNNLQMVNIPHFYEYYYY